MQEGIIIKSFAEDLDAQKSFLKNGLFSEDGLPTFNERLDVAGLPSLKARNPEIFQVNLGYMCNQTCKHCHVDAGPQRTEIMNRDTMDLCIEKMIEFQSETVDLTGGAPEMNPDFRSFVESIREKTRVREIIVRSNLTIILANPKYHDLPDFFRKHRIRVVSSLPHYSSAKTDRQRGKGVFNKSIEALKMLNAVGYGDDLLLDLVYNPAGAFLPGNQLELERDFKVALKRDHGILFNSLLALTNLPINRFLDYLIASGNYEEYMEKLVTAFNPAAVSAVMCLNTLSVDYRGFVFDCDFNQMLDIPIESSSGNHLSELTLDKLTERMIKTNQHCYGCTAGAGSGCQGSLVE